VGGADRSVRKEGDECLAPLEGGCVAQQSIMPSGEAIVTKKNQ
jgi:hypothetical protein